MPTPNNLSPIGQQLGLLGDLTGAGQVAESEEDRKKRLLAMQQQRLQQGTAAGSPLAGFGRTGY
jgi:hypothetical protein